MASKVVIEAEKNLKPFYFTQDGTWCEIPKWARFIVELGTALASHEKNQGTITLALAVPTRSYVALLMALGLISGRCNQQDNPSDPDAYLQKLRNLPLETPIEIFGSKPSGQGRFMGTQSVKGQECIRIQFQTKNKDAHLIPLNESFRLKILGSSDSTDRTHSCPVSMGIDKDSSSQFSLFFVNRIQAIDFAIKKKPEYLIIGQANILRMEAEEKIFGVKIRKDLHRGCLSSVLKVNKPLNQNDPCRTRIVPYRSQDLLLNNGIGLPLFTIFDGVSSFIKWEHSEHLLHKVVVLDKTESHFKLAVSLLLDTYAQRRSPQKLEFNLRSKLPPSMDLFAFIEEET